jgi:hypothetical protein
MPAKSSLAEMGICGSGLPDGHWLGKHRFNLQVDSVASLCENCMHEEVKKR